MSRGIERYYLGVNFAYHESSVCLMADGEVIVALEEERFNRCRHAKPATVDRGDEFPLSAVEHCLRVAGIEIQAVKGIGCSFLPRVRYEFNRCLPCVDTLENDWGTEEGERLFRDQMLSVPAKISAYFEIDLSDRWKWFSHHLCHLAGAYVQSGFSESALLCVDGIGEINSVLMGYAEGHQLNTVGSISYPNSLGLLWEKFSLFLGFTEYDAAKVMSLAAFGDPQRYREQMSAVLKTDGELFKVDNEIVELRGAGFNKIQRLFSLDPIGAGGLREQGHFDLVAALQERTEQILLGLLTYLKAKTGSANLSYSGGVALNCLANQKICRSDQFERVFIQPAANDAGTAVGAAYLLAGEHIQKENKKPRIGNIAYLGTSYSSEAIVQTLNQDSVEFTTPDQLCEAVAELLIQGKIIGWFQGRMEFGPRALGNRSILADPRNSKIKQRIDTSIKFREPFRPYAPSVMAEYAHLWFDVVPSSFIASRYMLVAAQVFAERAVQIPAVVHHDGSSRIHLVHAQDNPRFHALIEAFYRLTGVPMLLNTSFNSQSPIVETPKQALDVLRSTSLDAVVLEKHIVKKKAMAPTVTQSEDYIQFVRSFCEDRVFRTEMVRQFIQKSEETTHWCVDTRKFVCEYHQRIEILQKGKTALSHSALQYQISRW